MTKMKDTRKLISTSYAVMLSFVILLVFADAKSGKTEDLDEDNSILTGNIESAVNVKLLSREVRATWTLNDPELTLLNDRVQVTFQGPTNLEEVWFYMSVNTEFLNFKDADYSFKLKCKRDKSCRRVGGPSLSPGDVVYYGMKVDLKGRRKKHQSFLGRIWEPFPVTTTLPPATTPPAPVTCSVLSGTLAVGCKENSYASPSGYPTAGNSTRNPERGLYKHTETKTSAWSPLTESELANYISSGYTLVFRNFVLDSFVSSNISATILQNMKNDFAVVRSAGMKVIVRFCYSLDQSVIDDAAPLQLQQHIEQLAPILQENADIIALVQTGFIGVWGEWYYTSNYGNAGNILPADWEKRRQAVNQLLSALPVSRQIQLRTPNYKRTILNRTSSVTSAEAHTEAKTARIGHHNDCFLASDTDFGTYTNKAVEYPYLQEETLYVAQGGETCNPNSPRSDCPTALQELSDLHFTYLNSGYHPAVLQSWVTQGCFNQIDASLGYRLVGVMSRYASKVGVGSSTTVGVRLKNIGWAAPINYRSAQLVLRHTGTSAEYVSPLDSALDLQTWVPGQHDLTLTLVVPPSASVGLYEMYLKLPDGVAALQARPEYNILMENLVNPAFSTSRLNLVGTITVE